MRLHPLAPLAIAFGLAAAEAASAFALIDNHSAPPDITATHESAPRWCSLTGLSDGIQVGVEPGFAAQMGATDPTQEAALRERIVAAFRAWETEVLHFDITFEAEDVVFGPYSGNEIDLIAVTRDEFPSIEGQYGYVQMWWVYLEQRPLTNGIVFPGNAIVSADIYLDRDDPALQFSSWGEVGLNAVQRILAHEIGHTIGLGHPNERAPYGVGEHVNFDTDTDPENVMEIDPADPFGDLIVSDNRSAHAIMSNQPCGPDYPVIQLCPASLEPELTNDDIGGRDVLYPPEPSRLAMLAAGGCLVAALARSRGRA